MVDFCVEISYNLNTVNCLCRKNKNKISKGCSPWPDIEKDMAKAVAAEGG